MMNWRKPIIYELLYLSRSHLKQIEKDIKKVIGKYCQIKWKFVKEIKPTKSGNYLYTVVEVR